MTGTGWQRTWVRVLTTLLTLSLMIMIYDFSRQDAEQSDETSGFISKAIINILYRGYGDESPERQKEIYDEVQHVVRKCAHFSEYTLLGMMIRLWMESWFGQRIRNRKRLAASAALAGSAYAATDEAHQLTIDGRSGQWTDILLDSCSVLFGVFIGSRIIMAAERKKKAAEAT